jgi:quinoprotein glucose dehydrogenase
MRRVGGIFMATGLLAVAALATVAGQSGTAAQRASTAKPYTTWRSYGGGPHSSQYSALDQINKSNVTRLEVAWTYPVSGNIIFNPVIVDDVMYVQGSGNAIVALDAATGKELWSHPNQGAIGGRGMNYWENADRSDRRFVYLNAGHVTAIDARTGETITSFGDNGRVDLRLGLAERGVGLNPVQTSNPGRIFENLYIIPLPAQGASYAASPGDVHAYDVVTGKLQWVFHAIPHPGEFGYDTWPADAYKKQGGVHNWSEFTVDEANGIAFVSFGSPRFDFYGGDRKGDNLFGNSLVALDARTGRRIWHQQLIHHDLWDWDLPQAAKLLTIRQDGKNIDVVAQATKHGFLFVFERRTGRPIWPIEERQVPQSDVPGEWSSPTQPFPTKPAPFARQSFTEKDINPYLPEAEQQQLRERLKTLRNDGLFTPPSFEGSIQLPGHNGGANFATAAVDPTRGEFYIVSKALPTVLRIALPGQGRGGGALGGGPAGPIVTPEQKAELMAKAKELVANAGPEGVQFASPYEFMNTFSYGASAIGPPWSEMTAYDLNTGEIRWRIPTGSVNAPPEMNIPKDTGAHFPRNGPLVTAGGLVFLATGPERRVRAYDRDNGRELWVRDLPSGSEGMPASYEVNGRQYIVFPVATAGGSFAANFNQPPRGAGPGPGGAGAPAGGAAPAPGAPPEAAAAQGGARAGGGRGARGGGRGGAPAVPGQYMVFALPQGK